MNLHGVHTALVTPFAADGSVDITAFERLCRRQLDSGVHGLVPCGTTGETPTLTDGEWEALVRTAVQVAGGQVPVTAGIGTNCTRTTVENARRAKELGVTAGLMVFPYYNKPNADGHRAHVDAVLEVGLPLVLYHVPGRTGQTLKSDLLAELAERDGVIAVKEATGDLKYGGEVLRQTDTPILSGDDFTFLALLAIGGDGVISVVSNVAPAQTVEVYEDFTNGRIHEAHALNHALLDLVDFLFSDTNPAPCKAAMHELDLCHRRVRLPLAPYTGDACAPLLDRLGLL